MRPFKADDAAVLEAYLNHPELTDHRYIPWGFPDVVPLSRKQVQGIPEKWCETDRELYLAIVRSEDHGLLQ